MLKVVLGSLVFTALVALVLRAAAPTSESAKSASHPTTGEKAFFARLQDLMVSQRWSDARELILTARAVQPPLEWLARRDAELRLMQARIAHHLDSTTEMLAAAALYLNGDNARSHRMLELAREIYPSNPERAVELAKAVRRRSPDYPPVRRLLAQWQRR